MAKPLRPPRIEYQKTLLLSFTFASLARFASMLLYLLVISVPSVAISSAFIIRFALLSKGFSALDAVLARV